MSYSLTAHSPYEGMKIAFNGTDGRLEFCKMDHRYPDLGQGLNNVIAIYNRKGERIIINAPQDLPGGHGGADEMPELAARDCDRFFKDVEGRIL